MFFQKLTTLLATCQALNITMEQSEDKVITLSVSMKYKDDKAKLPPIVMSGTAAELDEGFPEAFGKIEANTGIFSNIDAFLEQAKTIEKDAKKKVEKTGKVVVPPTKPENTESDTDEPDDDDSEDKDTVEGDKTEKVTTTRKRSSKNETKSAKEEKPGITIPSDLFDAPSVEQKVSTASATTVVKEEAKPVVEPTPPVETKPVTEVQPVQTAPVQQTATTGTAPTKAPVAIVPDDDIF